MNLKDFQKFCAGKKAAQVFIDGFYHFLTEKYSDGVPANVNLEAEWQEFYGPFYRENTSHAK